MNRIIDWFTRNGVAANLLTMIVMVVGLVSISSIRFEVFPEFQSDLIYIMVPYPGAGPEEVEEGICVKIEETLYGLPGIKRITSTASENVGTVLIELMPRQEIQKALNEIKTRVDGIDTFPLESRRPVVREILIRKQVINVAISGDADDRALRSLGEQVRDELAQLPGLSEVTLVNVQPFEVGVEISEAQLRRYNLTFDEVADAVRKSSLDLPAGSIKSVGGDILLRTKGQAYRGAEFERLVLRTNPDGSRLTLGEVARVNDGFAESEQSTLFDGKRSSMVRVFRVGDQSALDISKIVKEYVEEASRRMPAGISLTTWQDDSKVLNGRLKLLLADTTQGFLIVFAMLALFLKFRLAFWVSWGIPVSFCGALAFMPMMNVSISLISLFAFILVLGIVVDDAIIFGENIHRHHDQFGVSIENTIKAAQEVSKPVIFSVLTNCAAFFPMLFIEGNTGKVLRVIPLITIPTLLVSLVESTFCLPAHLRGLHTEDKDQKRTITRPWVWFQSKVSGGLFGFIHKVYAPFLALCIRWRYLTAAVCAVILIVTASLYAGGHLRWVFFPDVEGDNLVAEITMPLGTPVEMTAKAIKQLEDAARRLQTEVDRDYLAQTGGSIFAHMLTSVGQQPLRFEQNRGGPGGNRVDTYSGTHLAEVHIELMPSEQRRVTGKALANRWRELTGPIAGAQDLSFSASLFSAGRPINIQLYGRDVQELKQASATVREKLKQFEGVYDVTDSFEVGKQEYKIRMKPEAESLGLTLSDVAKQVRQAFYGEEAQRIQRGRDDVRVMVRYPLEERRSAADLEDMRIRTRDGREIALRNVATIEQGQGFASIRRVDRQRTVDVSAEVDLTRQEPGKVNESMRTDPDIEEMFDKSSPTTVKATFEGARREESETTRSLLRGFLIALLLIYILLAVPFVSYWQPLLIMSVIPFGLVGAVWGHLIMGMDLTVLSVFGLVALTGIVVNDSIVLVDFINNAHKDGLSHAEAVRKAGVLRFRPIMLTSITTFGGLIPLIMEKSVQAQFLIPMAVSLGFGVLFSTAISLLLLPSIYVILEDFVNGYRWLYGKKPVETIDVKPAEVTAQLSS